METNSEIREARMRIADILGVRHNADGTEYYGMRGDYTGWMCVFHRHGTCVASDCRCGCHATKTA